MDALCGANRKLQGRVIAAVGANCDADHAAFRDGGGDAFQVTIHPPLILNCSTFDHVIEKMWEERKEEGLFLRVVSRIVGRHRVSAMAATNLGSYVHHESKLERTPSFEKMTKKQQQKYLETQAQLREAELKAKQNLVDQHRMDVSNTRLGAAKNDALSHLVKNGTGEASAGNKDGEDEEGEGGYTTPDEEVSLPCLAIVARALR